MLVNPEIKDWFDKLQGQRLGGGSAPRGQGLPSAPLEGIVKPERGMFGFNAPQIEGRFQARSPAPYVQPSPMRGIPPVAPGLGGGGRDLGGAAKAAGLQKLGAGIEQGLGDFAAKRKQQQEQAAMANAPGMGPVYPPGDPRSRIPIHPENGAPKTPPAPTFSPVGPASEKPILTQPGGGAGMTGDSIGPEVASLPTLAQGAGSAVAGGQLPVAQFLTGIKTGEGVPSYSGHSSTGALGPYGLTRDFIKTYGPGAGLPADKASYEGNQGLQDQLATYAATQMHDKYGDWGKVANAWLTGSPTATTSAPGNMTPQGYVAKVMNAANMSPAATAPATGAAAYAATPPTGAEPAVASSQPVSAGQTDPHQPGFDPGSVPFHRTPEMDQPPLLNGGQPGVYSAPQIGPQTMNDQANPLAATLAQGDQQPQIDPAMLAMMLSQNQPDSGGFFG